MTLPRNIQNNVVFESPACIFLDHEQCLLVVGVPPRREVAAQSRPNCQAWISSSWLFVSSRPVHARDLQSTHLPTYTMLENRCDLLLLHSEWGDGNFMQYKNCSATGVPNTGARLWVISTPSPAPNYDAQNNSMSQLALHTLMTIELTEVYVYHGCMH
jgi:hypothetical protein